jgi:hypothetical protein
MLRWMRLLGVRRPRAALAHGGLTPKFVSEIRDSH